MKDSYDVIVVGAGPAGSITAKTAAERGLSVLLIEKRQEIGEPVRCAEAISVKGLAEFIEPDQKWICAKIRHARFISPSGRSIEFKDRNNDIAYVLDRKLFDRDLARKAAGAGADIYSKTQATGLITEQGIVKGITGKCLGDDFEARAQVVVAADGIESRVARWAGINTTLRRPDIGACVQYHIVHPDVRSDCFEFYLGNRRCPGGYVWVFPKGDGEANVGLGMTLNVTSGKPPLSYLNDFVAERFPGASVLQAFSGGVPVGRRLQHISTDGLVLVGDAARLSDPATGEGILNGMISGRIAGNVIADAIASGDVSAGELKRYDDEISAHMGTVLDRNYLVKQFIMSCSDLELNLGISVLKMLQAERYFSTSRVYEEVFTTDLGMTGVLNLVFR